MTIVLLTSGFVVLLTCATFIAYELVSFRRAAVQQLSTIGAIIATNSTAALAFENADDARDILAALRAEPNVVAATLYDRSGLPFAFYPESLAATAPHAPRADGFRFEDGALVGFQPVVEGGNRRLGTLYLQASMAGLYDRVRLYVGIAVLVFGVALVAAYFLSRVLQRQISGPILGLARVAQAVSDRRDYSVRAPQLGSDELGQLTEGINHMLAAIQAHNQEREDADRKLHAQVARLDLLNHITRAIGERQDLSSIFEVILGSLEENMPVDFGGVCVYDGQAESLTVTAIGRHSADLAAAMTLGVGSKIPIDNNGLARCIQGHLAYDPNTSETGFPFPERLASQGLHSLVAAPLLLESQVFGILLAARRQPASFTSSDCEFIRQLSEHVALAVHQAQTNSALQRAYDDLRQSQQAVLQQERLRALGQMASGIAHDINNAISPITLYIQSLLEREPTLSPRAREYLETIERAVDDVTATVARMREFYRQREPQLALAPANLNTLVPQVLHLTRARWADMPQQRGMVIDARTELAPELPAIMGAENEIREALTNLVFNAVDAMPDGGTLTVSTGFSTPHVFVAVTDTGLGMTEETRRRCLEPFFTTKGERGTGLGLAMVYGMVQRHSAEIDIESAPGRGTTVRLRFAVPEEVGTGPEPTVYRMPSRQRILIVDDDPMLLKSLRDTLEADGHVIVTANGGQEGIDTFAAARSGGEPFGVVITDLGMPHVDGRRVASEIKSLSASTPIILLTGWGQRLAAENDVPPHVDRLLSKPPKLNALRDAIAQCVQLARNSA